MLDEGKTLDDVKSEHWPTYARYWKAIDKYADEKFLENYDGRKAPEIVVLWSPESGTGKSYTARRLFPGAYWHAISSHGRDWYDGYCGHDTIVFDEFDPIHMGYRELLQLLDRTPLRKSIKGHHVRIVANRFVFTSNLDPRSWYSVQPHLDRRLDESARIIQLGPLGDDRKLNIVSDVAPAGPPASPDIDGIGDPFGVFAHDDAGALCSDDDHASDRGDAVEHAFVVPYRSE